MVPAFSLNPDEAFFARKGPVLGRKPANIADWRGTAGQDRLRQPTLALAEFALA